MGQSTVAICCLLSDNDDPSNIPLLRTAQVSRYQEKPFIPLQIGRSKTFHYIIHAFSPNQSLSIHTHTHTHLFNSPLSGSTWVSRYQKGKTNLDFTEARDSEWQRHQLGHMQVCTSLQTDNHASTPPLSFLQVRCPPCRPTNSVKALKALSVHTCQLFWCITSIISSIPNLPLNSLHEPICYYNTTHLPNTILISACWSANLFSCQVSLHFCLRVTQ